MTAVDAGHPADAAVGSATLVVAVENPSGAPVSGVAVRILSGSARPERAVSDPRGEARFTAGAGPLQVIIDDPTYPPTTAYALLEDGKSQRATLQALAATRLTGTVVDGAGKPIAGAAVEILSVGLVLPPRITTDARGQFVSTLAEGSWRMSATKTGGSPVWTTLDIAAGQQTAAVTIRVPDAASLVITTDCASKGCPKAEVNVSSGNSGFSQYLDDAGSTTFKGLPIGQATVTVRHDADHRRPLLGETRVTLAPGAVSNARVVMATLDANATVSGTIVDRDGKPSNAGAGSQLVVDVWFRGFQRRVVAAPNGDFTVPDVVAGACTLTGLRIDPKDPMSGANGVRSVTDVVAPSSGVKVTVNDFVRR